jgi:hypothetical protein
MDVLGRGVATRKMAADLILDPWTSWLVIGADIEKVRFDLRQ